MTKVDQAAPVATSETGGLRRDVGLIGLMWASVGSIIGSGWLYGAEKAVVVAGPAAIISWVIGTVAIVLLALVHAELGGMFPVAGGTARYPHYAFGGLAGMSFGWFSWLQAATVAPIEVEAMIGYAGHWKFAQGLQGADGTLTTSGIVTAIVLMAIFVGVNFFGVRALAHTNSAATWWKIAIPLAAIFIIAAGNFHGSNFTSEGFAPFGAKGVLGAISSSGIIFALLGFEQAIQLAGESRNPQRDLPRATLGSVAIGAGIYILLQIVFIAALPHASFMHGWGKLAYAGISGPWAGLATVVGLGWLGWVLYVDAIISPGGTGLIYTTATSRVSYGLAKNGYAPKALTKTDKRGVPWIGLIVTFVTGILCFLPFPSWQELVGFITSASVLMYAGAPLAYGVFSDRLPHFERPYRLPFGKFISPASFVVANLIIYWSGWNTLWRLAFAILLGYVLMGSYALWANLKGKPDAPRMDFKAAQWLPAYLLGIGLISWQGSFGEGSQGNIKLYWDILVIAAFSLGIYYWAKATASKTEAIERSIDEVVVTDAPAH
ncbi:MULTISPECIES: APC family permease [Actinomycetes]|uniref:APC family permease n=2 Tax=Actinomycetes TaxID=1760 RepID=A0ABP5ZDL3_9ACTN|nr:MULTISPECIES: APC family permease [Streptomyces]MYR01825.1 amino acid permease [Streptomyces sp. SID6139]MYR17927.1 amino acid permease [Streptomyces sp. SID6137]MCE3030259.1 APC family permease [Streptomyces sp. CMSTAAHL-2]TGZ19432.1 amino acid permease [Streptomyces sp. S816]WDO09607.1 APC family permease [Streptomyces murinus]